MARAVVLTHGVRRARDGRAKTWLRKVVGPPCKAALFAPNVSDALIGDRRVDHGVRNRAMAHECLQHPRIDSTGRQGVASSRASAEPQFAAKTPLHQLIACGHSVSLRSERMVRERPSFVDAEGRTFGMGNQRIDGPATECRLGFRPKCLICGDCILASSACCCLSACL